MKKNVSSGRLKQLANMRAVNAFNPNQPRAADGKFASTGGGMSAEDQSEMIIDTIESLKQSGVKATPANVSQEIELTYGKKLKTKDIKPHLKS